MPEGIGKQILISPGNGDKIAFLRLCTIWQGCRFLNLK